MPHRLAILLVASGIDLIYIRDLLGQASVRATEVYARADSAKKREAIEAVSRNIVLKEEAQWDGKSRLKDWLKSSNRRCEHQKTLLYGPLHSRKELFPLRSGMFLIGVQPTTLCIEKSHSSAGFQRFGAIALHKKSLYVTLFM